MLTAVKVAYVGKTVGLKNCFFFISYVHLSQINTICSVLKPKAKFFKMRN